MKVRKAVKKIVALGVGATMLGASVLGATAADLGNFPNNMIDDESGSFNGLFVVGASAKPADIVGVNAVATAVQSKAVKETWVETDTSEVSFSSENGLFAASGSKELTPGENLSVVDTDFDEEDFPDLLAEGMVKDDDGESEEYDYDQELSLNEAATASFGTLDESDRPTPYLDFDGQSAMEYTVDFTSSVDISGDDNEESDVDGLADNEKIMMLGQEFTFDKPSSDTDDITLYESSMSRTIGLGDSVDVTVGGEDYTIELIAVNSDADSAEATLMVNGESATMNSDSQKTLGGLELKLDEIQINTIGDESALVKVFIGADELTLPGEFASDSADEVEINGEALDGVEFYMDADEDSLTAVNSFNFVVTPSEFDEETSVEEITELMPGDSFVDPLFNTLKYQFVESGLETEDAVGFSSDYTDLTFEFVNNDGDGAELDLLEVNNSDEVQLYTSSSYDIHASVFDDSASTDNMAEDAVFLASEEEDTEDEVTSFVQLTDVSYDEDNVDDSEATFENLNSGKETTVSHGKDLWDTELTLEVNADETINFSSDSAGEDHVITENLGKVQFNVDNGAYNASVMETNRHGNYEIADGASLLSANYTFEPDSDADLEILEASNNFGTGRVVGENDYDDSAFYATAAGTSGTYDVDDNDDVKFYIAPTQKEYNVWVGPAEGAGESGESGEGYMEKEVVPIPASATVLDSELNADPTSENLIVVGGPCVNSVAADLMGNPDNCAEGFSEGKAKIKLFDEEDGMESGKTAMLVAGYGASDTRRATKVLNNFEDYELSGKEVEVSGTSMTDITVGEPTVMEEEEETEESPDNETEE